MTSKTKIRVGIVDDQAIIRSGLSAFLLATEDMELTGEATNGEEAIQLCQLVQPDVLLMDIKMPGMDGITATRLIHQRWRHIKILALSSYYESETIQNALQAGAAGYLIKDINAMQLVEAIRNVYEGRKALGESAAQSLDTSRQLHALEKELQSQSPDASHLADLLEQFLPRLFPDARITVRLFPSHDLATYPPGDLTTIKEAAWKWLRANPGALIYQPGDQHPWGGRQPLNSALLLAPVYDRSGVQVLGGVSLVRQSGFEQLELLLAPLQSLAHLVSQGLGQKTTQRAIQPDVSYELAEAARIQTSILPQTIPCLPGWDLAARLQPARETSGDFYDFIQFSNGQLGIVIADVTDKGMGAALFMALSSTLIRTYASQYPTLPGFAMSLVNERILSDTSGSMFVTAFFGVLEPQIGRLRYVNAGHNPPFLLSSQKGKPIDRLAATGMALGVLEKASWQQKVIKFSPGDCLLLYTDGVTEAQNPQGVMFGENRLMELLRAHHPCQANELKDAIFTELSRFTGETTLRDDVALLVVARK